MSLLTVVASHNTLSVPPSLSQYLFATYIAPSATLDIGLDPEERKDIYLRIQPPFEDLFDTAEEYILLILLEPWTQMVMSDQVAYAQVPQPGGHCLQERAQAWPTAPGGPGLCSQDWGRPQAQAGQMPINPVHFFIFLVLFLVSFPIVF